jgi:hypothetical protein
VVFAGGLGAQIINAAVYFALKNDGHPVYADLTYFDATESIAAVGAAGEVSHWSWGLAPFGLVPASFERPTHLSRGDFVILQDGLQMLELGLNALKRPEIRKLFNVAPGVGDTLPAAFSDSFLCMHVRRGDFVNVASHLITDNAFLGLVSKFAGLVRNAGVISDSPIEPEFRTVVASYFKEAIFLDNIDAHAAHRIMRNARILICSNSTFSLTAAALNPNALVIVPKQWYAGKQRQMEAPIHERCSFQILENQSG